MEKCMSEKSKVVSKGSLGGAKGGTGHMFGKQYAGPKKAGLAGKSQSGSGGKWAKGGGTGHVGKQGKSSPVVSGRVSVAKR